MRHFLFLALFLFVSTFSLAAVSAVPAGTMLPVRLQTTLHGGMKPGDHIRALIMQNISLPDGSKIPIGSMVSGHVVSATVNDVAIQFDSVKVKGTVIPLATSLRAIAGPLDVQDAETPKNFTDGPFDGNITPIGSNAVRNASAGCEAEADTQALWVFSTRACGVYGTMELTISKNGKTAPVGQITLHSDKKLVVRSGSGMVLRVVAPQP